MAELATWLNNSEFFDVLVVYTEEESPGGEEIERVLFERWWLLDEYDEVSLVEFFEGESCGSKIVNKRKSFSKKAFY